jgi:fatty acid/phospholipid biosynthesis enzyme
MEVEQMKNIVMDLSGYDEGPSIISQAVKVFLEKSKYVNIYVVGNQKDLTPLSKQKNVTCVSAYNEGDIRPSNNDYIYQKSWEAMEKSKADVLITPADRTTVLKSAESHLNKIGMPILITRFLSANAGRFCFLTDCGANASLSSIQYQSMAKEVYLFVKTVFSLSEPKYSLVGSSNEPGDLAEITRDAFDALEGKQGFKGITSFNQILDGKCDIYLADGTLSQAIIQSMYSIYKVFNDKYVKYQKEDFRAKISKFFGTAMARDINATTSAKLDQTGLMLLGYDKFVINSNKTTNTGGIIATLNNAQKYLNSLSTEEVEKHLDK